LFGVSLFRLCCKMFLHHKEPKLLKLYDEPFNEMSLDLNAIQWPHEKILVKQVVPSWLEFERII
jgi:hypothetical protein